MRKISLIVVCMLFTTILSCSNVEKFKNWAASTKIGSLIPFLAEKESFTYTDVHGLVPVFDERESLVGYIMSADTNMCGSDCTEHVLFLHTANGSLQITQLPEFSGDSLGHGLIELNKNIFFSDFIWAPSDGHFGCHKFKVKKIKFINNKFEVIEEHITQKKYAFDDGDAQGQCKLYPGIKALIELEPDMFH